MAPERRSGTDRRTAFQGSRRAEDYAHGTRARYKLHCRCTPCKAAEASYRAALRQRHAKGAQLLGRRVPASPAWKIIDHLLRENFTLGQIARLIGCKRPILEINRETVEIRTLARLQRLYRLRYLE